MRPTKEIIELSKKLHELGYRQEIRHGDWMIRKIAEDIYMAGATFEKDVGELNKDNEIFVPIPSLEDGCLWLGKNTQCDYPQIKQGLIDCWVCNISEDLWAEADTPHEAVLKTMVKVLESAGKDNG